MHDNRSTSLFPFHRPAARVEAVHDFEAIPNLIDLQGKTLADAQAGANTQDDDGAVSQRVTPGQMFQDEFQLFGREGRATNHAFLLKPKE